MEYSLRHFVVAVIRLLAPLAARFAAFPNMHPLPADVPAAYDKDGETVFMLEIYHHGLRVRQMQTELRRLISDGTPDQSLAAIDMLSGLDHYVSALADLDALLLCSKPSAQTVHYLKIAASVAWFVYYI